MRNGPPGSAYLETQVLTASPPKLRLMLIEGALRFAHQALLAWGEGQDEAAFEKLTRCRAIVAELLAGIDPQSETVELGRKVAGIYLALFRAITEGLAERSATKIQGVIRVLEIERETWREFCEADAGSAAHSAPPAPAAAQSAAEPAIPSSPLPPDAASGVKPPARFRAAAPLAPSPATPAAGLNLEA